MNGENVQQNNLDNIYSIQLTRQRVLKTNQKEEEILYTVQELAEATARKLNQMIREGHDNAAFLIATILAIIKDFLDVILDFIIIPIGPVPVSLGEIPFIGQLLGIFITITLYIFMAGKGWWKGKIAARLIFLFIGDNAPFFNDFPFTTVSVLWVWYKYYKRAKKAKKALKKLKKKKMDIEEMETIERKIDKEAGFI